MSSITQGLSAPGWSDLPKRRVVSRRGGREFLKRLPGNYCWRLLRELLTATADQLSSNLYDELSGVFRRQIAAEYYGLDASFGLQRIAEEVDPRRGNPAVVHMLVSAFRKCSGLELVSAKQRRLDCLTNVRLVDSAVPGLKPDWLTDDVYAHARSFLQSLLGAAPDRDVVMYSAKHGPGSTASIGFDQRSKYFKLACWPYRSTPSARGLLADCIRTDSRWEAALEDSYRRAAGVPMWSLLDRMVFTDLTVDGRHPYNIVTTVPKDGRKDRPIAKEQTGNIYLQLGVGSIIRQRLLAFGVDLNHQADWNRRKALIASRDLSLFTVDLSSASDTVGYALVQALLPPDWFRLLDSLRAPWGVLPSGEAFLYRKFSSMGNGFTFELETVIFMAICVGVSRVFGHRSDVFSVFGDDIIGPDYLYTQVTSYLEYSGFLVNSEKSFHGPQRVRESCGIDALDGRNIRPFFVKSVPQDAMEAIGLRNRVRSWFLTQLGDYPARLDCFLIGDTFNLMPPIGPDSDVEFDGWLHDGPRERGSKYQAYTRAAVQVPAKEFLFRKLMHDLRSCTGEGGNFLVSDKGQRVELADRVVHERYDALIDH